MFSPVSDGTITAYGRMKIRGILYKNCTAINKEEVSICMAIFSYAAAYTKKTENGVPISINTQHLQ